MTTNEEGGWDWEGDAPPGGDVGQARQVVGQSPQGQPQQGMTQQGYPPQGQMHVHQGQFQPGYPPQGPPQQMYAQQLHQNYRAPRPQPHLPPLDPGRQFRTAYQEIHDYPRTVKALGPGQTGEEFFDVSSMLHLPADIAPDPSLLVGFARAWGWPSKPITLRMDYDRIPPGENGTLIAMGTTSGGMPQQVQPQAQFQHIQGAQPPALAAQGAETEMQEMMGLLIASMAQANHQEETIWTRLKEFRPTMEDLKTLQTQWGAVKKIIEGGLDWVLPLVANKWIVAWSSAKNKHARQTKRKLAQKRKV